MKLDLARRESDEQGIRNVEFKALDIRTQDAGLEFDVVYARFLLTHLDDPSHAVAAIFRQVRPGGLVIVEDTDFSGSFTYPASRAFRRYYELYCTVVRRRGGDPDIGPRLPTLLADGGFEEVELSVFQPIGTEGEVKLINPLTMEVTVRPTILGGRGRLVEAGRECRPDPSWGSGPVVRWG